MRAPASTYFSIQSITSSQVPVTHSMALATGFIGTIVILREKSLAFDDRILAAGGEGKVDAWVDQTRITSSIRGVSADLLPTFSENIRALDVIDPERHRGERRA